MCKRSFLYLPRSSPIFLTTTHPALHSTPYQSPILHSSPITRQEEKQRARARVRQYVSDRALEEAATRSHVRVQAHEQATLRDAALVVQRAWRAYYGKKVEERARRKEDLERRIQ